MKKHWASFAFLAVLCLIYASWVWGYTPEKQITLSADESAVQIGLPVTVTATLSDGAANTPVQFKLDGQNMGDPVNTNNDGEAIITYTPSAQGTKTLKAVKQDYDGSNNVDVTGVTVTLKAKGPADEDWVTGDVTTAAGAINNDVHKAQILIENTPAVAAKIQVSLADGQGHGGANNAKVVLGGTTVNPGETKYPHTSGGSLSGYMLSSNVLNHATVTAGTSKKVWFGGDNYDGEDNWISDPPYIVFGGSSNEAVKFMRDYVPMQGHTIKFFVEEVRYTDENGVEQVLVNTPANPSDPSAWASFSSPSATVNQDGEVEVTLEMANRPEMTMILLVAYDMTVFTTP